MKVLVFLLSALALLCSCKKGPASKPEAPEYAVALKLTPSAKVPDPEGTAVDYVYYHLYTADKVFVKEKVIAHYHPGDTLRDTLPDGKYIALVSIGYDALTHHNNKIFDNEAHGNEVVIYYSQTDPDRGTTPDNALNFSFHDFYSIRHEFTVAGGHQANLTLLRVPALITVNIEDVIPANVDTIAIDVRDESYVFNLSLQSVNPASIYPRLLKIRENAALVRAGKKINFYLINNVSPLTFTTYGITAAKEQVFKTTVSRTELLKRNDALTLSGKLFTPGSPPFVINEIKAPPKAN